MSENVPRPAALSWFTQSTKKFTPLIIEVTAVGIVLRLLGLVQPFVFQALIDRVLPFQREATLVLIVAVLVATAIFATIFDALIDYLANHMANRLTAELARRIYRHVLGLPLQVLENWRVGETLARLEEIDTVRRFLTSTAAGFALDALFATVYLLALLTISPMLTAIVVVMLPLQLLAFGVVGPFVRNRMQESFLAGSRHQSRLVEAFGNAVGIKSLACENQQAERFQETLNTSLIAAFRVTKLNILNRSLIHVLENSTTILIIFFGSKLVFQNEITLGELIAFHLLVDKVSGPILSLSSIWEQWQGVKVARIQLGDFLNTPAEPSVTRPPLSIQGRLRLDLTRLSFGYNPDFTVICNLTTAIDSDRPTIILGASGSGKSTLAKLVAGLYTPDGGKVEANGQDIKDCDPSSVRRIIAYVPQEPVLFSGSVLENLLLAKPDATRDEIQLALNSSASDKLIMQLSHGIDTDVGEHGSHLSGGQRQRIALARSLLTNPKALILDEPTSSLDAESAAVVVETLKRFAIDNTLVVVTHNPYLLGREVNVIIVDPATPNTRQQSSMEPLPQ